MNVACTYDAEMIVINLNLEEALGFHRLSDLEETRYVGSCDIVSFHAILLAVSEEFLWIFTIISSNLLSTSSLGQLSLRLF